MKQDQPKQPTPSEPHGIAPADYKEPELTLEAKQAIRSYIYKIVAPLFALSGVFLFFLGYLARDFGEKNAYADAYKEGQNYVRQLTTDAVTAKTSATTASDAAATARTAAEDSSKKVAAILADAERTRQDVQRLTDSSTLKASLAEKLAASDDFKRAIVATADERLKAFETRIGEYEKTVNTNLRNFIAEYNKNSEVASVLPRLAAIEGTLRSDTVRYSAPIRIVAKVNNQLLRTDGYKVIVEGSSPGNPTHRWVLEAAQ